MNRTHVVENHNLISKSSDPLDHNHRPGPVTTAVESRALGTHCSLFFARKVNYTYRLYKLRKQVSLYRKSSHYMLLCCCFFLINRVKTNDNLYIAHKLSQFVNL